jgi:hypothetical protein
MPKYFYSDHVVFDRCSLLIFKPLKFKEMIVFLTDAEFNQDQTKKNNMSCDSCNVYGNCKHLISELDSARSELGKLNLKLSNMYHDYYKVVDQNLKLKKELENEHIRTNEAKEALQNLAKSLE